MRRASFPVLFVLALWGSPLWAVPAASAGAPAVEERSEPPPELPHAAARSVRLGEHVLLTLSHKNGAQSPEARAREATQVLGQLLGSSEELRVRYFGATDETDPRRKLAELVAGESVVLALYADDLGAADVSAPDAAVERIAAEILRAFEEERKRTKIASWVLSFSSVVFLGLLALLLLRGVGTWARKASRWQEREGRTQGAIRVGTIELIPASAVREGLRVGLVASVWLFRASIVYFWIIWSLSLFDATRGLAESATGTLLRPMVELLGRIAGHIPVVVALLISLFLVGLLMRLVAAYFRAIERGEIQSEWVEPATARVTGGLLLIGLALGTLLFVTPLLTGATEGVLSQLGLLALAILALATLPLLVSCTLGVRLVYSRALRLGDDLAYGGQRGIVRQIGLFDVLLEPSEGGVVRVFHLMSLWHATRIYRTAAGDQGPAEIDP